MRKGKVLILFFVLFFPRVFYGQMNALDNFKMQQQSDQLKQQTSTFKNQIQSNAQQTTSQAQQAVIQKQEKAEEYKQEEQQSTDLFEDFSKKAQKPTPFGLLGIYGIPILLIAVVIGVYLFIAQRNI